MDIDKINTIKGCFEGILSGNKEESRLSSKRVRKVLYSSSLDYPNKFKEIKEITINAPKYYNEILENWRKENFAVALGVIYYLHGSERKRDFLFPWLFELLGEKNGVIRYSAVKMIENEFGFLTYHIRFPKKNHSAVRIKEYDKILYNVFMNLNNLLDLFWDISYKKYKYINDLPACSYKSVQMILAELEDCCGKEYMDNMAKKNFSAIPPIKDYFKVEEEDEYEDEDEEYYIDEILDDEIDQNLKLKSSDKDSNGQMPKWMDCTWCKIPCNKDSCPICGKINRDRRKHIENGEDPDNMDNILKDIKKDFIEVMEEIKKDIKEGKNSKLISENVEEFSMPENFGIYRAISNWRDWLYNIAQSPVVGFWVQTEEADELLWYTNILMTKVYRQLYNRQSLKDKKEKDTTDYDYTNYVLKESFKIIKESLNKIIKNNPPEKGELNLILKNLLNLEKDIKAIFKF